MIQSQETFIDILEWSAERPGWQRDALRRLFVVGKLTDNDLAQFIALCKSEHGLDKSGIAPVCLTADHLPITTTAPEEVSLVTLTHHRGANALALEQSIAFGDGLTVVFGENATGKSGYTRILKQACRSRAREDLLGNVLDPTPPLALDAAISFKIGASTLEWKSSESSSGALALVSIFDSQCAPVYLRDKTDVAFRPFGLDVFDTLAIVCGQVRTALVKEQSLISATTTGLPVLSEGTTARKLIDSLKAFTDVNEVLLLAKLSQQESERLKDLKQQRTDLQSANPTQLAKTLRLKASRLESAANHIVHLTQILGPDGVQQLEKSVESLRVARVTLEKLQKIAFTEDLLPGTGKTEWRNMWEAVSSYVKVAYPHTTSLALKEGERCPFCQQEILPSATERMRHFSEYISSTAQTDVTTAESALRDLALSVSNTVVRRTDLAPTFAEIALDMPGLSLLIEEYFLSADAAKAALQDYLKDNERRVSTALTDNVSQEVRAAATKIRERAELLDKTKAEMEPGAVLELRELEARETLSEKVDIVLAEIDRQKRVKQYDDCIADTNTTAITKKSTELTTKLVTVQLQDDFQEELRNLEFKHVVVELKAVGGEKGSLYHQVVFSNAPGVEVAKVLSEGESRSLSLAAFLAELSTAETKSAIIFDDPVSSLDHAWRERIAKRLVLEAKQRQVIIFTHDLLFLHNLLDQAKSQEASCHFQHIVRGGQVGIASSELPWIAMPVNDRIGKLRVLTQAATKIYNTEGKSAYEPEAERIYGMLRESWEHAVTEVLLNDVVERYRHSIETKKLRGVIDDICEEDYKAIDEGMNECSRWMRGHDRPCADCTPYPDPVSLSKQIDDLDTWSKGVRKRRQKK